MPPKKHNRKKTQTQKSKNGTKYQEAGIRGEIAVKDKNIVASDNIFNIKSNKLYY
jgi:hypothetical protein